LVRVLDFNCEWLSRRNIFGKAKYISILVLIRWGRWDVSQQPGNPFQCFGIWPSMKPLCDERFLYSSTQEDSFFHPFLPFLRKRLVREDRKDCFCWFLFGVSTISLKPLKKGPYFISAFDLGNNSLIKLRFKSCYVSPKGNAVCEAWVSGTCEHLINSSYFELSSEV
jgi:hypothetical protein